jgi:hypothetical protein
MQCISVQGVYDPHEPGRETVKRLTWVPVRARRLGCQTFAVSNQDGMETAAGPDNPTIQLRRSVSPRSGSTIHRDVSDTKPDTSGRYIFHNNRHIHAHHRLVRGTGFTWTTYLAMAAQFKYCRQGFFTRLSACPRARTGAAPRRRGRSVHGCGHAPRRPESHRPLPACGGSPAGPTRC